MYHFDTTINIAVKRLFVFIFLSRFTLLTFLTFSTFFAIKNVSRDVTENSIFIYFALFAMIIAGQCNKKRNTACEKLGLRYFTLTDDEHFYRVYKRFMFYHVL